MTNTHKAQPEQEPVAYGMWDSMIGYGGRMMYVHLDKGQDGCTVPLYTHPPVPTAQPKEPEHEPVADTVNVPRDLIGAACFAIEHKRDAPNVLEKLRRYTVGDLSLTTSPQQKPLTDELNKLRKALVYVAHALHATPQYMLAKGIVLIDGDTVQVSIDGYVVEASDKTIEAAHGITKE